MTTNVELVICFSIMFCYGHRHGVETRLFATFGFCASCLAAIWMKIRRRQQTRYIYIHICTYIYIYSCISIYTYVHISIFIHACTKRALCLYAPSRLLINKQVIKYLERKHKQTHTHAHTHMYIYIYICA